MFCHVNTRHDANLGRISTELRIIPWLKSSTTPLSIQIWAPGTLGNITNFHFSVYNPELWVMDKPDPQK